MEEQINELNNTFTWVRLNRQARITVMRQMALVAWIKLPSKREAPKIEPRFRVYECRCIPLSNRSED